MNSVHVAEHLKQRRQRYNMPNGMESDDEVLCGYDHSAYGGHQSYKLSSQLITGDLEHSVSDSCDRKFTESRSQQDLVTEHTYPPVYDSLVNSTSMPGEITSVYSGFSMFPEQKKLAEEYVPIQINQNSLSVPQADFSSTTRESTGFADASRQQLQSLYVVVDDVSRTSRVSEAHGGTVSKGRALVQSSALKSSVAMFVDVPFTGSISRQLSQQIAHLLSQLDAAQTLNIEVSLLGI